MLLFLFWLAFLILPLIAMWKIYEKAGEAGWQAIIPIYNMYVLLKIVGKPGWWLLLYLVPVVNWIFAIWTINMLSKSFGKEEGFTIGILILGFIFLPILAFGPAEYQGPYGDPVRRADWQATQNNFDFEQGKLY